MDYQYVDIEGKINGLNNRIGQLEAEHYTNEIYLIEARVLGYEKDITHFTTLNEGIVVRLAALKAEVDKLSELIPDSEDESDSQK